MRYYGGQPVDMGNAGAFQAQAASPLYTTPLSPVWGGGPLVPGSVPGRESFLGPAPTQRYRMSETPVGVGGLLAGGNFMGGAGSAINPEAFKKESKQQKIYNKGMGTDNPNEREIFLKRTGPQLPLAMNGMQPLGNAGVFMDNAQMFMGPQFGQIPAGFQNKIVS